MNVDQPIRSHRDLKVWQMTVDLGIDIYRCTARFPSDERSGLVSQLRRGGVSIASNIAEGYGRGSRSDYIRFLKITRGALCELDTQVLIADRLGYLPETEKASLTEHMASCGRLLAALIKKLERKGSE
jgi:four helix bundle protein